MRQKAEPDPLYMHSAGRSMSRRQAKRLWDGRSIVHRLSDKSILIRSPSLRGIAEEAPDAYKDVNAVVRAVEHGGLGRIVAKLEPLICIKG